MNFKKRVWKHFIIILLPVLLYFLVGPLEIYIGNISEFNFELKDFYIFYAVGSVILLVLGSVLLSLLPSKVASILEVIICAISYMSYIQNMFLNRQLINQDGTAMDWSALQDYTRLNLAVWIVGMLLIGLFPLICKKYYRKIYLGISIFLSALQLVAFISLLIPAVAVSYEGNHYTLSGEKQYQVAKEQNIIVFVLDHYANETFENSALEHPEMLERLQDFTYFDNADCHYNYTFPSLSHLLTGMPVDCQMEQEQWKEACWSSPSANSFYSTMHDLGYECNFYSAASVFGVLGNIANLSGKIDNVIAAQPVIDHALLVRLFEKMTIYRNAPYILKPRFETLNPIFDVASHYEIESGVEYENIAFYQSLQENGLSFYESAPNGLTIIHLEGTHGLRTTTAQAEYTDRGRYEDDEEPTEEETAAGLSIILDAYFEELKRLGVYDHATIILTADHGDGGERPQPIFFIKAPQETHEAMQINHAPISHDDFFATLMYCIGEEYQSYGSPVFHWSETEPRERQMWVPSEGFKVYTYTGDREALIRAIEAKEYEILGRDTGWKHSW